MEIDANTKSGENSGANSGTKGLKEWLCKSRVKRGIVVLAIILLIALVGILLSLGSDDSSTKLMKLWPLPNEPKNLIHYTYGRAPESGFGWPNLTTQLDELFSRYTPIADVGDDVVICNDFLKEQDIDFLKEQDKVCNFHGGDFLQHCTSSNEYGYPYAQPCIFFEFNNITDWDPEPYTSREAKKYIDVSGQGTVADMVFLDCQGVTDFDKEYMGPIDYTPNRGFQAKYFPYRGHPEYKSPIVAVRFTKITIGVAVSVRCKLWAKNIDISDKAAEITFNLLVD